MVSGKQIKSALLGTVGLIVLILAWVFTNAVLAFVLLIDAVLAVLALGACCLVAQPIWLHMRKSSSNNPSIAKVRWTIAFCALGFLGAAVAANLCCLPHKLHPLSLLADGVLFACSCVIGWAVLAPDRHRTTVLAAVAVGLAAILGVGWLHGPTDEPERRDRSIEALSSLPYITWAPVGESKGKAGVTHYDRGRAFDGINLYKSRNESSAHLIDMSGRVLHTWTAPPGEERDWFHVEVYGNGDLLVVVKDGVIIRLDWDSNIRWMKKMRAHHDVAFAENGDTYALAKEDKILVSRRIPIPVLSDYIMVFSTNDQLNQEISLFRVFEDEIPIGIKDIFDLYEYLLSPSTQLRAIRSAFGDGLVFKQGTAVDVMHTNSIEIIDRDINDVFSKGNVLTCSRTLDLIGVIDPRTNTLKWSWGKGELDRPHHPTLLHNGNVLVFDNGWTRRHFSRVLEIDPQTEEIIWEYTAGSPKEFFSPKMGASQRLPNGNTLITNSYSGQVFEVTHSGETVWEFHNPVIEEGHRAVIYRMERIYDRGRYPFLDLLLDGKSGD